MTEEEIAKVARGLTKAQCRMILLAHETFIMERMKLPGKNKGLRSAGLATLAWRGGDLLTEDGLAVRKYLETHHV